MGTDDKIITEYLSSPEHFCDFFNGTVFQGEQILDQSEIKPYPQRTVSSVKGAGNNVFLDGIRDVVMKQDFRGIYAIFAAEAQSHLHYAMPVRTLGYDAAEYLAQVKVLAGKNRRNKILKTSGEFLSGLTAGDRLVPVFNVILYYGTEDWDAPLSLKDMLDIPKELEPYQMLIPDYRVTLIQANKAEPSNFLGDWRLIFGALRHAGSGRQMEEYFDRYRSEYEHMDDASAEVLMSMLRELESYRSLNTLRRMSESEKEENTMCKAFDEIREKYRIIGQNEGQDHMTSLITFMTMDGLSSELPRLGTEPEFLCQMLQKYQLEYKPLFGQNQ